MVFEISVERAGGGSGMIVAEFSQPQLPEAFLIPGGPSSTAWSGGDFPLLPGVCLGVVSQPDWRSWFPEPRTGHGCV